MSFDEPDRSAFPADFVWGVASSAYEIEGATAEDGRGVSIWDSWCRLPGTIQDGSTGDIAADHYHRWPEDVAIMSDIGLNGYRFSTSWVRVLPDGRTPNPAGLDFYDRLVDQLLAAGIAPFITLNHWDIPQALQDAGGWTSREMMGRFVDFADAVTRRLGDRVTHWMTQNEPWVISYLGYYIGQHAPGIHGDGKSALQAAHHLLVSHGMATPVIRSNSPGAQVGIVNMLWPNRPASDSEADIAAADRADGIDNRWFLDALFKGSYPQDILDWFGGNAPSIRGGDMELIATPTDFMGMNSYYRRIIAADPREPLFGFQEMPHASSSHTGLYWSEIDPAALGDFLVRLQREWNVPAIYVTESGIAMPEDVDEQGFVDDQRRIDYLAPHIREVGRAIREGAPVRGYFVWCLLDTFCWNYGYVPRFGLVRVERPSLRRIPKASAAWYRDFIRG